jgi:hypothetical protein
MTDKILIIGNGPCVLDRKRGRDIDNFDGKILRFNNYRLQGYEKYLGTRTDIWALGVLTYDLEITGHQYDSVLLYLADDDGGRGLGILKENMPGIKIDQIPLNYIIQCKIDANISENKKPTTGLVTMYWFLHVDPKNIYMHGFDFCDRGTEYWKDEKEQKDMRAVESCHDMASEKIYVKNLINKGIIKIL